MRKWTYLVAALLISGTATTFTSCIDNEEPAGITELRGAKAELLKAKAQVQVAEAAFRTAQAAIEQAKADFLAEKVAQEKFATEIAAAQSAKDKAYWEQQAKLSAEQFKADLLQKEQATAEAKANYDKAIIAIEAALVGYKESVYAAELQKVLSSNPYTVSYTDASGNTRTVTLWGLMGVSNQLNTANETLAKLMREKATIEFSYDIKTKIAATEGQLAKEQGELEGLKKDLENLKVIAGTKLEDWDAKYQEFDKKKKDLDAKKTNLAVAKEEALKPIREQEKANITAVNSKSELAFDIPAAIQDDFYWIDYVFDEQATENAQGEYSYPNGVKAMLTMNGKAFGLNELIESIEEDYIVSDNELAQAKVTLGQYKTVKENNESYYDATLLPNWKKAFEAYLKAFEDGKYFATNINDYDVIVAKYNAYVALPETNAEDIAAKEAAQVAFAKALKNYLTVRVTLDGFKIAKAGDATKVIDPTVDADWNQWVAINNAEGQFGTNIAGGATPNMGGAYKEYVNASSEIGYLSAVNPRKGRCVEYTYAQYLESLKKEIALSPNSSNYSGAPTQDEKAAWDAGKAKVTFSSINAYEKLNTAITNKPMWDELYADLKTLFDNNAKALEDLRLAEVKTAADKEVIESGFYKDEAAIDVEIEGIIEIMNSIASAVSPGATAATYDAVLEQIKNDIAVLEGGEVTTGDEFNFISNGSIVGQEVVIASYQKLLAALKDGSYKPAEEAQLAAKNSEIAAQQAYIAALEVVFKAVSAKKDQLMEALTK